MAPRRGVRVVKVDHVVDYENLTVKEVLCPICRSILIEPVTLPCNHVFCSSCFQGTMENANLVCPLCRIRIGSWLRYSKKENKLINVDYWNAIKKLFPVQIKNKLEGIEEDLDYETPLIRLSKPGELKKEYETQFQKETETIRLERVAEAKASEDLIRKLREEEEYQKVVEEEKMRLDEEIAKKLAEELKYTENDRSDCSQSSKLKSNANFQKKIGPLDRYLKCKDVKKSTEDNPIKKFDFAKKEYTCRILCQDIGDDTRSDLKNWKSLSNKSTVNTETSVNITMLNKISDEFESIIELDGNSDSSDSIDSEYRYFKPVEYRRNPPCQKTIPVKVPTLKMKTIPLKIRPPRGQRSNLIRPGISAFARFTTGVEEKEMGLTKANVTCRQVGVRRKSMSPRKKPVETSASAEKTNNNTLASLDTSVEKVVFSPKKNNSITKIDKTGIYLKRKPSESGSPKKKIKAELDDNFGTRSRLLATPSSPFRGFCVANRKGSGTKTSPNCSLRSHKTDTEKEKLKLQEEADYELAIKLQNEFNNFSYSTRSSAVRKGIKVTRQTTLDNMLSKKSYKV